jgi:hypothetical protein
MKDRPLKKKDDCLKNMTSQEILYINYIAL